MLRNPWFEVPVLLVVAVVLFSASIGREGHGLPHEGKHAEIAREMLWEGKYDAPRLLGRPYHEKPPVYYWLGALFFQLAGRAELWGARLVGVLMGAVGVLAVYLLARRLLSSADALPAALLLAVTIPWIREAGSARTDMPCAAFTAIMACALWLGMRAGTGKAARWIWLLGGGLAASLSLLSKTPFGIVVVPSALALHLLLDRTERRPRGVEVLAAFLAFLLPTGAWALWVVHSGEGAYIYDLVLGTGLAKAWNHYPKPWYNSWAYYLGVFPLQLLPLTILLPGAIVESLYGWRDPDPARRRAARIPLLLLGIGILAISIMPSKRGQYLLPVYPFSALLLAMFAGRWMRGECATPRRLQSWIFFSFLHGDRASRVALLGLVIWMGGVLVWRSFGLFEKPSGEMKLLECIQTQVPADARAVSFKTEAEPFAFAWPTVPCLADTPEELQAALSQGVEYLLVPEPFFRYIPGELASRLEKVESEEPIGRHHPIQLWRVASGIGPAGSR